MIKRRKGFSLPEISVVILTIMVLSSVATLYAMDTIEGSRYSKAKGEIALLASAVSRYRYDMKAYPATLAALKNVSPYGDGSQWVTTGMFPATDPWGNSCSAGSGYCYAYSATGFAVWTMGKNGGNNSGTTVPGAFSSDDIGMFGR